MSKLEEFLYQDKPSGEKLLCFIFGEALYFRTDPKTEMLFVVDQQGEMVSPRRLRGIFKAVEKFFEYYGEDIADDFNEWAREVDDQRKAEREVKPKDEKRHGWIYLVEAENKLVKIGMTRRTPSERLEEFVPKLPYKSTLLGTVESDDVVELEACLHRRYADQRVRGEWFRLTVGDVMDILEGEV